MILEIGGVNCYIDTQNNKWREFIEEKYKNFLTNKESDENLQFSIIPQERDNFFVNFSRKLDKVEIYTPLSLRRFRTFNFYFKTAFATILINQEDFLLHASGIKKGRHGLIFAGKSGSGKSEIIKLAEGKYQLLNDDFAIIRKEGRRYYIYSSPFYETNPVPKRKMKVPLKWVYFLRKAESNKLVQISKEESITKIVSLVLTPLSLANLDFEKSRRFLLKIWRAASILTEEIPCSLLYFRQDSSFFELLK